MLTGLKSMCGTICKISELPHLRALHRFRQYENRVVLMDEVESRELPGTDGPEWAGVFPAQELTMLERTLALQTSIWGCIDDKDAMLRELLVKGLDRPEGLVDYAYAQMLATSLASQEHIVFDVAKCIELNKNKPPSHCFKSGFAHCATFSQVYVMACRVNNIPARMASNIMGDHVLKEGKENFSPGNAHVCVRF